MRRAVALGAVLLVAVSSVFSIWFIMSTSPEASPEARYAALTGEEKERMVNEVGQRLNYPLNPKIVGFGYGEKGFHILFSGGADPETLTVVREVIGDLPLEVSEHVRCEPQ